MSKHAAKWVLVPPTGVGPARTHKEQPHHQRSNPTTKPFYLTENGLYSQAPFREQSDLLSKFGLRGSSMVFGLAVEHQTCFIPSTVCLSDHESLPRWSTCGEGLQATFLCCLVGDAQGAQNQGPFIRCHLVSLQVEL